MDDTTASFIARYEAMGLEGTPASPKEVVTLQEQLGLVFPVAYKAFLLILGRDGGSDFIGSDCTISALPRLRSGAENLLQRCGSEYTLPERAMVFLMHQGYSFVYFVADGASADPPVFAYVEGDTVPVEVAGSFTGWLGLRA
ncbi:MAG TPA: SMI1/KNR4 family protein [Urbifossiella sp.]|jgi:hypothetical protein|nr:SMI1/KNR4 family protein [Urbifossiella sp.]